MATYTTTPLAGCSFDMRTTDPLIAVGTVVPIISTDIPSRIGKFAMYIKASAIILNSSYATVDLTTVSCLATSVDGGAGTAYFRNGSVAFAANEYGFIFCTKTAIPA